MHLLKLQALLPYRSPGRSGGALLLMLALLAPGAQAEIEPVQNIRDSAERFLHQQLGEHNGDDVEVQLGHVDERLRLKRCDEPLEASLPPGGRPRGNTAVNIRCPGPVTWSVYVPAAVERHAEVVVARRNLSRQQTLGPGDLRMERIETSRQATHYFEDASEVVGLQTRRAIRQGQVIGQQHVNERQVIQRGQRVTILASSGSVTIRMQGEALEDATAGDWIRVRNTSSGREIEGEVQPSGTVRVAL
ncbi:flagella basal body P-ring formation protein FlgA [Thioalkalivibrio sp. ALE21]|nr:flagellar basal body P-ring formation chaperone FlgA [Thioalkalivibrio sp. AKL17]PYG00804.1 flagella basal body P-ring formation protein FlgA [Thioalkalivibrio sp. ALE21]